MKRGDIFSRRVRFNTDIHGNQDDRRISVASHRSSIDSTHPEPHFSKKIKYPSNLDKETLARIKKPAEKSDEGPSSVVSPSDMYTSAMVAAEICPTSSGTPEIPIRKSRYKLDNQLDAITRRMFNVKSAK